MKATVDSNGRIVYQHPVDNAEIRKLEILVDSGEYERVDSYTWRERLR